MRTDKTIFVVDDDMDICSGLRWLFESVDLKVETFQSAREYLAQYDARREGCLIVDVRMPLMSGLELLDRMKINKSILPVIVITGHGDIPMAIRAMKAGAVDFILKPINDQHLLETIHYHLDNVPVNEQPFTPSGQGMLTKREQQVIDLIIDGKLNKEIAYELKISLSTVEAHRSRIMQKFHARNLAELIKKYFNIPDNYHAK